MKPQHSGWRGFGIRAEIKPHVHAQLIFGKGTEGKQKIKNKPRPLPHTLHEIRSKRIINLKVKA